MVTIRRKTYRSQNNWHVTATRLGLDVEIVDDLVDPFHGNSTVDTDRPWVGWIENETKTFEVTRTSPAFSVRSYFEGIFFTVFAQGALVEEGAESTIKIRYGIPWMTAVGFAFIYLFTILSVVFTTFNFITDTDSVDLSILSAPIVFISIPATLLLVYQLNKMEREVTELLGVQREA